MDEVVIGTWADAPNRFWASFVELNDSPEGYELTGGLYDTDTRSRVPGIRIDFGNDVLAVPWNDTAHQRMFLLAGTTSRCSTNSATTSARPSKSQSRPARGSTPSSPSADGTKLVISVHGADVLL